MLLAENEVVPPENCGGKYFAAETRRTLRTAELGGTIFNRSGAELYGIPANRLLGVLVMKPM